MAVLLEVFEDERSTWESSARYEPSKTDHTPLRLASSPVTVGVSDEDDPTFAESVRRAYRQSRMGLRRPWRDVFAEIDREFGDA
jgi:hypothetical protein